MNVIKSHKGDNINMAEKREPDLSVRPEQRGIVTFAEYSGFYKNGRKLKTFFGVQVENVLWYIKPDGRLTYAMINLGEITKTYSEPPEGCDERLIAKYNEEKIRFANKAPKIQLNRFLEVEISENEFKMLNAYRQLNREQKLEVNDKIKSFLK